MATGSVNSSPGEEVVISPMLARLASFVATRQIHAWNAKHDVDISTVFLKRRENFDDLCHKCNFAIFWWRIQSTRFSVVLRFSPY